MYEEEPLIPKDYSKRQSDWLQVEINSKLVIMKSNCWGVYRYSPELTEVCIGGKTAMFKNTELSWVELNGMDKDVSIFTIHFHSQSIVMFAPIGILQKVRTELYKNMSSNVFFSEYDLAVLQN